jgi:putative endonuclease
MALRLVSGQAAQRGLEIIGPESDGAPMYYVYILRCADDNFYVGSARDLDERVKAHNTGRGAAYTFKHRPVYLVYSEIFDTETAAVKREQQLKRWSHKKKQALVDANIEGLKHLSKSRSPRVNDPVREPRKVVSP